MLNSLFLQDRNTALILAIYDGYLELVDKLLDKGANIEAESGVRK